MPGPKDLSRLMRPAHAAALKILKRIQKMSSLEQARLWAVLKEDRTTYIGNSIRVLQLDKKMFREGMDDANGKLTSRNRKPDPENVKRNIEMCDRRNRDKKTWSYSKLAQTYDMTKRAVAKILAEEQKWRSLVK